MAGRKRRHYDCQQAARYRDRTMLNAYVRTGNPSRWTVVGEICLACNTFEPSHPRPQVSTQRDGRRPTPTQRSTPKRLHKRPATPKKARR